MNRGITVIGFTLSMFNNVIVPYIVNQQPSQIAMRNQCVTWLNNGTYIRWIPCNNSARGVKSWEIFCNINLEQGFCERIVLPMLSGDSVGIRWFNNLFEPVDPPRWYKGE